MRDDSGIETVHPMNAWLKHHLPDIWTPTLLSSTCIIHANRLLPNHQEEDELMEMAKRRRWGWDDDDDGDWHWDVGGTAEAEPNYSSVSMNSKALLLNRQYKMKETENAKKKL